MDIRGSRRPLMSERYALAASAADIPPTAAASAASPRDSQFGADTQPASTFTNMAAAPTHSAPAPAERRDTRAGSRRIFPPQFKLQVLDAYRRDAQCRGNQRATARKFGIHRRQIQKWLQAEPALRAALLRRAPQPAPSPPPYSVGSPESARLPSPPPAPVNLPTSVAIPTPLPAPIPVLPPSTEPIDLSMRRLTSAPVSVLSYAPLTIPEQPQRKPFKLFRPYLLDDEDKKPTLASLPVASGLQEDRKPGLASLPVASGMIEERKPAMASLPVASGVHVSAFVPVASACLTTRWCMPPSFAAPLR